MRKAIRYRASVCSCQDDQWWGKRLQAALKPYSQELAAPTSSGVRRLSRPIFQDSANPADISPGQEKLAALEASQFLIVICSTSAAKSKYLNDEIRHFKLRRGSDHIVPVIVDGHPGDFERECFPPALLFKLDKDGMLTWEHDKLIAVDARQSGKSEKAATQQIAARLLGLNPDELVRRCERKRQRRNRVIACVSILLLSLAVLAPDSVAQRWQQLAANEAFVDSTLKVSMEMISATVAQAEKFNLPRGVTIGFLHKAERVVDELVMPNPDAEALSYRQAWVLIEFARNYDTLGYMEGQAGRLMREVAAHWADDLDKMHAVSMLYAGIGRVLAAQGALNEAIESYRASLSIMERIASDNPENLPQQRDLSLAYFTLGTVLFETGAVEQALDNYHQSLALTGRIVSLDALNFGWQSDLADIYIAIGDVLSKLGNFTEAIDHYWKSELLLERLVSADRENRIWHSQLDYTRTRIANVWGYESFSAEEHPAH